MDTSGIQKFLHSLFKARLRGDRFEDLPRQLFVVAVEPRQRRAVPFGAPGWRHVPVSKAVGASTALPGLYRPVRIAGRDYVDGGVRKTAHINLAIQNGADLVICINPIVPFLNDTARGTAARPPQQPRDHLGARPGDADHAPRPHGVRHGALPPRAPRGRHPSDRATRDDLRMFGYHIMRYGARRTVAEHGYRTALDYSGATRRARGSSSASTGSRWATPRRVPDTPTEHAHRSSLARALDSSLDRLDSRLRQPKAIGPRANGGARTA